MAALSYKALRHNSNPSCSSATDEEAGTLTRRDLAEDSSACILASLRCLSHTSALENGSDLPLLELMFPLRLHMPLMLSMHPGCWILRSPSDTPTCLSLLSIYTMFRTNLAELME